MLYIISRSSRNLFRNGTTSICRLIVTERSISSTTATRAQHPNSNNSLKSRQDATNTSQAASSPKPPSMSDVLASTKPEDNSLLAPVHIPEDARAVITSDHPATSILAQSGIVVQRQIEMMNLFLGFEQANRYVILDPEGNHIGYMAEHDGGLGKAMGRQWFRTHRAFTTHIFDRQSKEVLRFHRPFSWINSRIRVYDPLERAKSPRMPTSASKEMVPSNEDPIGLQQISDIPLDAMRVIGEAQSEWAPLRRKYDLFLAHEIGSKPLESPEPAQNSGITLSQFARIDEPFLSWDFSLMGRDNRLIGSVNRHFRGFGRELFTDTGSYALRMDSAGLEEEAQKTHIISKTGQGERAYAEAVGGGNDQFGMTLDQRAVMLATAVTVDFDYFSRHSRQSGAGFLPLWMWGGSEGGAAGGAAGAEAGAGVGEAAGGAVVGGAGRAVGGAAGAAGAGEGAIAGAGTMAGYEAMQRGLGRTESTAEDASPTGQSTGQEYDPQSPQSGLDDSQGGDVWGTDQDPWSNTENSIGDAGGGGSEGGGGIFSWLWDQFFGGD